MPLDGRELHHRVNQLRKSLKDVSKNPTVDEVHHLRTRTRRVESILQGLGLDTTSSEHKLRGGLKSVRKAAGKVRDLDVMTSYVVGLGLQDDPNCLVRLVHHLGTERQRKVAKLRAIVRREGPQARTRLKDAGRKLDSTVKKFSQATLSLDSKDNGKEAPLHAMSVALRLSRELGGVRRLGRDNLHQYRIELKRLRYLLEMANGQRGAQQDLLDALQNVQDSIGEWHDWVELRGIAAKVLKQDPSCQFLKKIHDTSERKYAEALRLTEQMRRRYLQPGPAGKGMRAGSKGSRGPVSGPVLVATAEIAA